MADLYFGSGHTPDAIAKPKAVIERKTRVKWLVRYLFIYDELNLLSNNVVNEIDSLIDSFLEILFLYFLHYLIKSM